MDDQCLSEAKTDRVLAIYSRLVGGAVLNKADLAQQFHVTQRSIQRDIESLRCFFAEQELPQDIVYDKRSRGYRLIDNARRVPGARDKRKREVRKACQAFRRTRRLTQGAARMEGLESQGIEAFFLIR